HPQAIGVFGNWGQAVANEVVSNADAVLVVGSRLAPTDPLFETPQPLDAAPGLVSGSRPAPTDPCFENPELLDADRQVFLQIDVEPLNVGRHYPVKGAIVADARDALAALIAELKPRLT